MYTQVWAGKYPDRKVFQDLLVSDKALAAEFENDVKELIAAKKDGRDFALAHRKQQALMRDSKKKKYTAPGGDAFYPMKVYIKTPVEGSDECWTWPLSKKAKNEGHFKNVVDGIVGVEAPGVAPGDGAWKVTGSVSHSVIKENTLGSDFEVDTYADKVFDMMTLGEAEGETFTRSHATKTFIRTPPSGKTQ